MNTKKLIMSLLCAAYCCQLSAKGFNRIYGGYSVLKPDCFSSPVWGAEDCASKGGHLGYLHSFNITKDKLPLFFQCGVQGMYVANTYSGYHGYGIKTPVYTYNTERKFFNFAIPLNFVYQIPVGNTLKIEPVVGANVRFNIIGEEKWDETSGKSGKNDFFCLEENESANRVQLGVNVGLGFNIKHLYLGYTCTPDITSYIDGDDYYDIQASKTLYHQISLGWNF